MSCGLRKLALANRGHHWPNIAVFNRHTSSCSPRYSKERTEPTSRLEPQKKSEIFRFRWKLVRANPAAPMSAAGAIGSLPLSAESSGSAARTVAGKKITGDESPVVWKSDLSLGSIAAGGLNTDAAPTARGAAANCPSFGNFITIGSAITGVLDMRSKGNGLSGSQPRWLRAHPDLSEWLPTGRGTRLP